MDNDSERAVNKGSSKPRQITKNQIKGDFLKKVSRELWESGDFHISGEIKRKSDYAVLTDEGEIEDSSDKGSTHLEICVKDAETQDIIPGLDIRAFIMQDGEKVEGPIDLPFLFRPNEAVYAESIVLEEGVYDIQLNISNEESGEEILVCFEKMGYMT